MIIDAHNHPEYHGHGCEKMIADMDACGIDKTWLLSWICPPDEFDPATLPYFNVEAWKNGAPVAFERCLAFCEKYPERFVLGYAPDPRKSDAIDKLAAAVELYGVKLCGEVKLRMMYDNFDAIRFFRFAGAKKLPVTLHFDYEFDVGARYPRPNYWYGGDIGTLGRVLEKCPETVFLGHAPGFWAHISGDELFDRQPYPDGPVLPGGKLIELMERYPNLYCDISAGSGRRALSRDLAFGRDFLIRYQDRVLYARDMFDNGHRALLESLSLPKAALEKIYWRNAARLTGTLPEGEA